MELFFSLRCTDVPLISKLWIWCTSVWNHRQVFFFPSAKVQASQAHSQPVDVTCSHRITEQAERALHIFAHLCTSLHIFAHLCTMFFHVFSCKQMQAVLNANAFFQGYPGYPCQDHQRHFAVQLRVASAGQISLRGWRDAESSADDIIRHQLIKFDQIWSNIIWS